MLTGLVKSAVKLRDHILSEAVAKHNGILEHCMYCDTEFSNHDAWKIEINGFSNYVIMECPSCKREHRFNDNNIHTIEDLMERLS